MTASPPSPEVDAAHSALFDSRGSSMATACGPRDAAWPRVAGPPADRHSVPAANAGATVDNAAVPGVLVR
ncbi:hypothetical protein N7526_001961 [Penicillium atrosanguineum]|nr:hypothetical protein N7526_001961 [Penicillium atrosanguineum]